jgi:hypothetical protein
MQPREKLTVGVILLAAGVGIVANYSEWQRIGLVVAAFGGAAIYGTLAQSIATTDAAIAALRRRCEQLEKRLDGRDAGSQGVS